MGALFRSGHITIWTDVDGVYSADPRKVRGLRLLWGAYLEALGGRGLVEVAKGGTVRTVRAKGVSLCHPVSPWCASPRLGWTL